MEIRDPADKNIKGWLHLKIGFTHLFMQGPGLRSLNTTVHPRPTLLRRYGVACNVGTTTRCGGKVESLSPQTIIALLNLEKIHMASGLRT